MQLRDGLRELIAAGQLRRGHRLAPTRELARALSVHRATVSAAYADLESEGLFAGDTLFQGNIGRTDLPGGNTEKIFRSLKHKLLALDDDTVVVPGHGPLTTIGQERATNPFLRGL